MGLEHVLSVQPLPQLFRVGDWDNPFGTVYEAVFQGLATRDGPSRSDSDSKGQGGTGPCPPGRNTSVGPC